MIFLRRNGLRNVDVFDNFENKYFALTERYPNRVIVPIMWFIDDSLVKNRNYYLNRMSSMAHDYECSPKLYYGGQMFQDIDAFDLEIWEETLSYLEQWKETLPDMPEINFDLNANVVFDEIKDLPPIVYRKLLNNNEIVKQIFPIIFPEGKVLDLLSRYFYSKNMPIYKILSELCLISRSYASVLAF